jgi:hypothetical protein
MFSVFGRCFTLLFFLQVYLNDAVHNREVWTTGEDADGAASASAGDLAAKRAGSISLE